MKLKYLKSAHRDIAWWRRYYRVAFPQGRAAAGRHYLKAVDLVLENPFIGRPVEGFELRQLPIPNTPFQLIYRVTPQTIEIIRVWDMRQQPTHGFQED